MITIATSVFPSRIEQQQEALNSWINHGFSILSVNSRNEIEQLQHQFSSVTFVEDSNESNIRPTTPYISINSLLGALIKSKSLICGIINSDVLLHAKDDFYQIILNEASHSLIYGSRTDVDINNGTQSFAQFGLDYFFFPARSICIYPAAQFYLGRPCWDYWFPLIAAFQGVPLKRLIDPIAFHYIHEVKWGRCENIKFGAELLLNLNGKCKNSVDNVYVKQLDAILSENNFDKFFRAAHSYLRAYVPWLHCNLSLTQNDLLISNQSIGELKLMLAESEKRERLLLSSRSWRLTGPLRLVKEWLKGGRSY